MACLVSLSIISWWAAFQSFGSIDAYASDSGKPCRQWRRLVPLSPLLAHLCLPPPDSDEYDEHNLRNFIHNFPIASSSLYSCRGVAECGDPLVSSLIRNQCRKELQLRNLIPAFCKAHAASASSWSGNPQSAQSSVPPTRVTKRRVAMCLMRPAPLRIAMARPPVASSLISRLLLTNPSWVLQQETDTSLQCSNISRGRFRHRSC